MAETDNRSVRYAINNGGQIAPAATIGTRAWRLLERSAESPLNGYVIAQFEHCVYVEFEAAPKPSLIYPVVCVGADRLERGPLMITLNRHARVDWSRQAPRHTPVNVCRNRLRIGRTLIVTVDNAARLPSTMDQRIRGERSRRVELKTAIRALSPHLVDPPGLSTPPLRRASQPALSALRDWLTQPAGDLPPLHSSIDKLVGLGQGLTPAGDDYLIGVIATLKYLHADWHAEVLARRVAALLPTHTPRISAAYVSACIDGEHSELLVSLLTVLTTANRVDDLENLVSRFAAVGHSSGLDTLAGVIMTIQALPTST